MTATRSLPDDQWPGPLEPGSASHLLNVQNFVVRRWLVIGFTLAVVLFATAAILRTISPRFTAHAEILLDPHGEKPFGPDNALHLVNLDNADMESAIALIRGGMLLGRVVATEHLAIDPEFVPQAGAGASPATWTAVFRTRPEILPVEEQAAAALWRALRVERIGKSFALTLSVSSLDPGKAARLTNGVAQAFVDDQRNALLETSRRTATYFADRLGPLGEHLHQSEDALERFRRDHDLISRTASATTHEGTTTINEQRLGELNSRLVNAQAETAQAWARFSQAQAIQAKGGALESIPDVVRSNLIVQLRQQQAEVARKEADLAARYTDGYPLLVNARAERREAERAIAREVARILTNLKGDYDVAKSQEDSLRASLAITTGAAGLDNDLGPRLRELERQKLVDQTLFETYLAKAREAEQQASFETRDIRVISPAERPVVPSYPQRWLVAACMTVFGLGLGVGLGLMLDALAPGFLSPRHTETELGLPVIAAVPWLRGRERTVEGKVVDPSRYLASRPESRYAEAMHSIRAGVRMSGGEPAKVVLVTSSSAGEGKSVIALSLALSATRAGLRVLLLDADLRSPSLSRYFALENRLGLADLLTGLVGSEETTVQLGGGLALMPGGRRNGVAPDLLASARMDRYLAQVRQRYDLVVVDAAPSGVVVDARVLAEFSDRIVYVVSWRATSRELVARSVRALGHPRKLAGIVLNKIDERRLAQGLGWARAVQFMSQRADA